MKQRPSTLLPLVLKKLFYIQCHLFLSFTYVCKNMSVLFYLSQLIISWFDVFTGENYIGDSCTGNSDCVTVNSECREGSCQCIPGYSFSPNTHECKGKQTISLCFCKD